MVQLILSGTKQERLKKAYKIIEEALGISSIIEKGHPDLIILKPTNSLGIAQIRILQKQLALKPYSAPMKAALIIQAEKLTIPAQNALLKTLEEPPAQTLIILLAPKKEALLPTIVSRCQLTQLIQKPQIEVDNHLLPQYLDILTSILNSRKGERLKLAEKFNQRQKTLLLVQNLLYLWREILLIKTGAKKGKIEKKLLDCLNLSQIKTAIQNTETTRIMLEANVNPRLTVENLFLSYPTVA